jgi:hypothetical protein
MNYFTTPQAEAETKQRYSPRATLVAVGTQVRRWSLFGPIRQHVQIAQKSVKHTPVDKLYDGFIALLAGAQGLVEINKRVRSDTALQAAFGRSACAEQSVVQDTLDACTAQNVAQMECALDEIYRQRSGGYRHRYSYAFQVLDVDMTGQPCGKKAEFASKGYFAGERNRRGRQVGRVLATHYNEIVVERLYGGTTQLAAAFVPLLQAAEKTLGLAGNEAAVVAKRGRTIIRMDAGGGSVEDVNWALERGYQVHGKDYSGTRAQMLAQSVRHWVDDPRVPGRQVGWVSQEATEYVRPVRRIAVRCRKANGQWGVGVLISTVEAAEVLSLSGQSRKRRQDADAVLLAYVYFYDQRGGGVETSFKEDKQGLGIAKRNKKRFAAQQMVTQLNALAHNVLVWTRQALAARLPQLQNYGLQRLVRDVLCVSGLIVLDAAGRLRQIVLNRDDPWTKKLLPALRHLLAAQHVAVTSGET